MKYITLAIVGTDKILSGIVHILLHRKKQLKIYLFFWFFTIQFLGYLIFIENKLFLNSYLYLNILIILIFFGSSILAINILMIEYGVLKKTNLNEFNSIKKINKWLERIQTKYPKTNKIDIVENNILKLQKNQSKRLLNKKILAFPDVKTNSAENTIIKIRIIFKNHKQLFKSLNIDDFIDLCFNGIRKSSSKKLNDEELNNIIGILILLNEANKIKIVNTQLANVIKFFFNHHLGQKSLTNKIKRIKGEEYRLTNNICESEIIDEISKI